MPDPIYGSFESRLAALAPSYGCTTEDNESGSAITLTANTSYYPWITGVAGLITPGTDLVSFDGTSKGLLIGAKGAGIYRVSYHFSGTLGAANELRAAIFKNAAALATSRCDQDIAANGKYQAGSASVLVALIPADVITLQFGSGTNTQTFTVKHAGLSIVRIG